MVKEYGQQAGIKTIENAAVPRQELGRILDTKVSFAA
jgi:hypothetical protein